MPIVHGDGESLEVQVDSVGTSNLRHREVRVLYTNSRGQVQTAIYRRGQEIDMFAHEGLPMLEWGVSGIRKSYLPGWSDAYERLGPLLWEQLSPAIQKELDGWIPSNPNP